MPVYEYACDKCGHEFEAEQRISDDPIRTCPKCRARKVKRLISRTSFVLKGSGWYSDLYSSKSEAKGEQKSSDDSGSDKVAASDAKSETKSDSSSEAKPAAKADAPGKSKKAKTKPKAA